MKHISFLADVTEPYLELCLPWFILLIKFIFLCKFTQTVM